MPRDVNGNYTLPAGNPVVSGNLIESVWANTLTSDLEAEMTDSLSRSGKGGFTGPVGIVDFSGSIPGLNFIGEPTSGFKREGTGDTRMQVTNVDAMRFTVSAQYARSGGALKEIVVEESGQKIMRGEPGVTVIFSYNDTAPPGWSVLVPDGNIRQLVIGNIAQGGTIGGNRDPISGTYSLNVSLTSTAVNVTGGSTGSESGHTHPGFAHNHWWYSYSPGLNASHGSWAQDGLSEVTFTEEDNGVGIALDTNGNKKLATNYYTRDAGGGAVTGSGSAHSHGAGSLSGSVNNGASTGSLQVSPRYARGILIRLST